MGSLGFRGDSAGFLSSKPLVAIDGYEVVNPVSEGTRKNIKRANQVEPAPKLLGHAEYGRRFMVKVSTQV